jgi:hypothetical protein
MKLATAQAAFDTLEGGTFVGMDTLVDVKLTGGKKNAQQGRVTKQMIGATVMCFTNSKTNAYDAMVRRRLEAEGKDPESFELGQRAWGTRITGTPFVEHNGKHYLEVIFMKSGSVQYMLDGKAVDSSAIEGLPDRKEGEQSGLENKVVIRTFALDSIVELRAAGQTWR